MSQSLMLIPARGGSKGIPRKNLALIGGRPLLEFTMRAALEANLPGRICLSTDDKEIREVGLSFNIEAPFLRPPELAQDHSGTIPVIKHALDWYEKEEGFLPEFVILLQPTCPFRTAMNIRNAFWQVVNSCAESLISVNRVAEHPCEYITPGKNGFSFVMAPPEKPGRQNFPEVFFVNGAIYIARVDFFKQNEKLFDENALIYVMARRDSLDIDNPDDLEYANWLYMKKSRK